MGLDFKPPPPATGFFLFKVGVPGVACVGGGDSGGLVTGARSSCMTFGSCCTLSQMDVLLIGLARMCSVLIREFSSVGSPSSSRRGGWATRWRFTAISGGGVASVGVSKPSAYISTVQAASMSFISMTS